MIIKYREKTEGAVMHGALKTQTESGEVSSLAALISGKPLLFLRHSRFTAGL